MNDPMIKTYSFAELGLASNPRKTLRPETIVEMGRSILEHGIIQPPVAREREGRPFIYMGQRRYRGLEWAIDEARRLDLPAKNEGGEAGSRAEELERVQVILREVSDEAMLFEQWVENLQREDVLPQEEAQGFYELSQTVNPATGKFYTAAEIAKAVGRSNKKGDPDDTYVTRRMKLRLAPEFFLEAVNRKEVATTTAELLGKIPDPASRELAAKMILKPEEGEQALDYKLAKALIRERFMISLSKCGFATEDETLVPAEFSECAGEGVIAVRVVKGELVEELAEGKVRVKGGSCEDCPMRSGCSREVMGEYTAGGEGKGRGRPAGVDPNLCTNPACFREKKRAHWARVRTKALEDRCQVIDGEREAKALFSGREGDLAYDSKYVDLAEQMPHWVGNQHISNPPKWGEVAKGAEVPVLWALNPYTLNVHKLAERVTLIERVKKTGKESGEKTIFDEGKGGGGARELSAAEKRSRAEAALKSKIALELSYRAARAVREKIGEKGIGLEEALLIFKIALDGTGADGPFFMGKMLGVRADKGHGSGRDYSVGVYQHVRDAATTLPQILSWIPIAILSRNLKNASGPYGGGVKGAEDFMALADAYGVDVKALEAEIGKELREGKKKGAEPKASKKKAAEVKLKTVTRSKSAARNQASQIAAEKTPVVKKKKQGSKRDRLKEILKKPGATTKAARPVKKGKRA
jgi:ParB-like chromosome segregation protein Spo0J